MTRKKILLVDDDRIFLKATSLKLVSAGYDVVTAEDGAAAVSKARTERPDLILLDLSYPPDVAHGGGVAWDGFLILNWLRRLDEAKTIPVIIVSVGDAAKIKPRALSQGAIRFFQKPVDNEQLLAFIQQTIAAQKPADPTSHINGKKVLFVDDEGDWRFVASTCLEDAGFEVLTAKDIAEALQRMEKVKLDAIILDVNLAGENGLLLIEFLKQSHPGVPILIYTGLEKSAPQLQEVLKKGQYRYLRKSTMNELCSTIKSIVE